MHLYFDGWFGILSLSLSWQVRFSGERRTVYIPGLLGQTPMERKGFVLLSRLPGQPNMSTRAKSVM